MRGTHGFGRYRLPQYEESQLRERVVVDSASGSHAGDQLLFSQIHVLSQEIDELEKMTAASRSPELTHFISQMRNLVAAANREGNGIAT